MDLTQRQRLFLRQLLVWLLFSTTLIFLISWSNPVQRAVVGMGLGLVLLWVVLCGGSMWRFRAPVCRFIQSVRLDWRLKFVLFCTVLAMTEEAITTGMT